MISIILPVYNGENFLHRAISSILSQTYKDFELIICDDGSIDGTKEIVDSYSSHDSRILYFKNECNKGLPISLNLGIKRAKGEFVTWTSHDNLYKKNALNVMMKELKNSQADFVYSDCEVINDKDCKIGFLKSRPIEYLIFGNVVHACFLYRKSIHSEIGWYDQNFVLFEDMEFWFRCALKFKMKNIDKTLYKFRFHESSLTHSIKNQRDKRILFDRNRERMYHNLIKQFNLNAYLLVPFFLSPMESISKAIKNHILIELYSEFNIFIESAKCLNSKKLKRIFVATCYDVITNNSELHRLSLVKIIFSRPDFVIHLSVKKNMVLLKKAFFG